MKNVARPDAFVNKEQWNVIQMKENYHAKVARIYRLFTYEIGLATK